MVSQDGDLFIKQLASFVRTHEKGLANALQIKRQEPRHGSSQSNPSTIANAQTPGSEPVQTPDPSSTKESPPVTVSIALPRFTTRNRDVKPKKLALTPHHLFYLLSRFQDLSIVVGPMNILLDSSNSYPKDYASWLSQHRSKQKSGAEGSLSASNTQNLVSGMFAFWDSIGIGQKDAREADVKYLYSAFTKIPCLLLAPDERACGILGYEEFPRDTAVPLHVFKNLVSLEIKDIDFRQFLGWNRLADQLRSLTLRQATLDEPSEILIDIVLHDMDQRRPRPKARQPVTRERSRSHSPKRSNRPIRPAVNAMGSGSLAENNDPEPSSITREGVDSERASTLGSRTSKYPRGRVPRRQIVNSLPNSETALPDLLASKWRSLRHLSLPENCLTTVHASSLAPICNTIQSLDLSSNLFIQIPEALASLTTLRALNVSHCVIDSLHTLHRNPLPAVTALNLRGNRLQSLAGIERSLTLERLDLRDNRLDEPMEIARLTSIPDIREIWVQGNPFVFTHKNYRVTIFNLFRSSPGYAEDIVIDGVGPSYFERRQLVDRASILESTLVMKPRPYVEPLFKYRDMSKANIDPSSTLKQLDPLRPVQAFIEPRAKQLDRDAAAQPQHQDDGVINAVSGDFGLQRIQPQDLPEHSATVFEGEAGDVTYPPDKARPLAPFSDSGYASKQCTLTPSNVDVDAATVYSGTSNISATTTDEYKSQLVNHLVTAMDLLPSDVSALQSSIDHLGSTFRTFARKLHGEASSPIQREASVFINKHKSDIVEMLKDRLDGESQVESHIHPGGGMPVNEVSRWIEDVQDADFIQDLSDIWNEELVTLEDTNENLEGKPHKANHPTDFMEHWSFVQETGAYQWLLSRLHQQIFLSNLEPNHMHTIGQTIHSQLWSKAPSSFRQMSRTRTPGCVKMTFFMEWDLIKFLREQDFSIPPQEAFEQTICLTGSWSEAQATSCRQYMEQTWPLTSGPIMSLLTNLISTPEGTKCSQTVDFLDGLSLAATMQHGTCIIEAYGGLDLVPEIGEQLGWLGSALRSSPVEEGVVACSPEITSFESHPDSVAVPSVQISGSCSLRFCLEPVAVKSDQPGFCWNNLFRNPVLVTGYPIPRRKTISPGLEMPINVMAELARSRRISKFCGRRMIKGFCTVLIPVLVALDSILWHLVFNPDGTRISYVDAQLRKIAGEASEKVSIQDIENKRHILGWCSSIVDLTGHPRANFQISSSGLRSPPSSTNIEKVYLEAGDQIVGGVSIALAKRDKPARFQARVDYIEMVDWVSSQAVVFYDVSDRRAWLVDGASAVLHLVRASLGHDAARPAFRSSWLFESGKLNESSDPCGGRLASVEVLVDDSNRSLPIYTKSKQTGEQSLFQDRVEDILHYLQQMMDHQSQVEVRDGLWLRNSFKMRKNLIGFDFYDIFTRAREVWPRIHYLRETGYGWVDFVRSIKAVTIFGSGFGDLLKPDQSIQVCSDWTVAHSGQDYLVASLSLLKMLHTERSAPDFDAHEIVRDIHWASPHYELFKPCACIDHAETTSHSDPVQVLLPKGSKLFPRLPKSFISPCTLGENGAVIFGHNRYFRIRWPNEGGAPIEGEPAGDVELNRLKPAATEDTAAGSSTTQRSSSPSGPNESSLTTATTTLSSTEVARSAGGASESEGPALKPGGANTMRNFAAPLWSLFKRKSLPKE